MPTPTGTKQSQEFILSRGLIPFDPKFRWLTLADPDLHEWEPLIRQAFRTKQEGMSEYAIKATLKSINFILTNLENLGFPKSPVQFFSAKRTLLYKDYLTAKGTKPSNEYRLGFNIAASVMDEIIDNAFSEADDNGVLRCLPHISNPLKQEPIPPHPNTGKKRTHDQIIHNGYFPTDEKFEWIERHHPQLLPWKNLLTQAIQDFVKKHTASKALIPEINWFITHLKELGLPLDPNRAFRIKKPVTFEKYVKIKGIKNTTGSLSVARTKFNRVVMCLDLIIERRYSETIVDGSIVYDEGVNNPLQIEETIQTKGNRAAFLNLSLKNINAKSRLPRDPKFSWFGKIGPGYELWAPLLTIALSQQVKKDGEKIDDYEVIAELNRFITNMERLSLPVTPYHFYSSGRTITLKDYLHVRGNKGNGFLTLFDQIVDVFDNILLNNFSEEHSSGFIIPLPGLANPLERNRRKQIAADPQFRHFDKLEEFYQPWKKCLSIFVSNSKLGQTRKNTLHTYLNIFFIEFLREEQVSLRPEILLGGVALDESFSRFLINYKGAEDYKVAFRNSIYDALDFAVNYFSKEKHLSNSKLISPIQNRAQKKATGKTESFHSINIEEPRMIDWTTAAEAYLSDIQAASLANQRGQLTYFFSHLQQMTYFSIGDYLQLINDENLDASLNSLNLTANTKRKTISIIFRFIEWLRQDLSDSDEHHQLGNNPVKKAFLKSEGAAKADSPSESTKALMPRFVVDQLMNLVFPEGATSFSDLAWMIENSKDWYEVPENLINKNDPDCVWKTEEKTSPIKRTAFYMWSPCFSVELLLLSHTALRGHQILFLDSGESDTYRYTRVGDTGYFEKNEHPLSRGTVSNPHQQGVFYSEDLNDLSKDCHSMYVNTNKTADIGKDENKKGYITPLLKPQTVLFWLVKLRDWQENYNPVRELTRWEDIPKEVIGSTNKKVMARRSPGTFLFRDPCKNGIRRSCPGARGVFSYTFRAFMDKAENELVARSITRDDGLPIQLAIRIQGKPVRPVYTVHAFRVSMISYLILEAGIPIEIVSKLIAGHASIVMTLYYTKVSQAVMREVLDKAEANEFEAKKLNTQRALENEPYEKLTTQFAGLQLDHALKVAKDNPATGYLFTDVGICPVSATLCHIGGEYLKPDNKTDKTHLPVPGYPKKNCIRCRFNLTNAAFLPGLFARANEAMWHVSDQQKRLAEAESDVRKLEDLEHDNKINELPFADSLRLKRAREQLAEVSANISESISDIQAAHHLIQASLDIEKQSSEDLSLVSLGAIQDIEVSFTESDCEIYSTAVLCQNAELYQTIDAGKATLRQAQLLDLMLEKNEFTPVFFKLNEKQQLLAGNALMRLLQRHTPNNTIGETLEFTEGKRKLQEIGLFPSDVLRTVQDSLTLVEPDRIFKGIRNMHELISEKDETS